MTQSHYRDGRNSAKFRMEASDQGVVFEYGHGPESCDYLGAREAWVFEHEGLYHMTYDGSGLNAWLVCLATSTDLVHWKRHGPIIACGKPGSPDSATASYGTVSKHGGKWHMFYLGSPNVTPAPNFIPSFPYLTLKAEADSPRGPCSLACLRDAVRFVFSTLFTYRRILLRWRPQPFHPARM